MNFKQIMITIVIIIFFAISLIVAWIFFKPFLDPALKPEDKDSVNSLEEWKTQCLIKGKETYDGDQLRNKLGQKSKILYDIDANEHRYRYEKDLLNEELFLDNLQLGNTDNPSSFWRLGYLNDNTPPQGEKQNKDNKEEKKKYEEVYYSSNGKDWNISEYNPKTGHKTEENAYYDSGKKRKWTKYNAKNGLKMKELIYDKYTADKIIASLEYKYYNNYKVHSITEYKPENLNLKKKETYYDKDNSDNIISFAEYAYTYESESTNAVSTIKYYSYTAYDGQNSHKHKIKEITYFKKDGKDLKKKETEYGI